MYWISRLQGHLQMHDDEASVNQRWKPYNLASAGALRAQIFTNRALRLPGLPGFVPGSVQFSISEQQLRKMRSGSEEGSYLRLIYFCITQLWA